MCNDPQNITLERETVQVACRVCNECIATRKNDWVARVMAEKQTSPEVMALELTYRNAQDGTPPDGARAFKYQDVTNFLKLVREWYYRAYGKRGELTFIVAGERGSKRGRCHWHMILMAKQPLGKLGKWSDFLFKPLPGPQISEMGKSAKMIHWTAWPHGHVVVKEPTQAGVAYILKYALKDQFNVQKSKKTARFAKAENHGASYFRMSKQPPIGFRYIEARCDAWEAMRAVPPNLALTIPDYSGYWWPKGKLREYLLLRLHEINEKRKAETGKDCPQWNTLLSGLVDEHTIKDWETLVYGPEIETVEEFNADEWQERIGHESALIRKQCGGALPCRSCFKGLTGEARYALRLSYEKSLRYYYQGGPSKSWPSFEEWYKAKRKNHPLCVNRDTDANANAFNA